MAADRSGERYEARINRAIALVDAHLDADLSLEALAEAACLSPLFFGLAAAAALARRSASAA
jgi:transcriptional regulator GlxA family with amidase domain